LRARILVTTVAAALLMWGAGHLAAAGTSPNTSRSPGQAAPLLDPPRAPVISSIEQPVTYRQRFTITSAEAARIVRVAIHAPRDRSIQLVIVTRAPGSLVAAAPSSPDVASPGHYLLTIAERRASGLVPSAPVAFVLQAAGGSPFRDGTRTGAQPATDAIVHRSPMGSLPWMPVGLILAFLATAAGLRRIS
jgi:hypothetical protein